MYIIRLDSHMKLLVHLDYHIKIIVPSLDSYRILLFVHHLELIYSNLFLTLIASQVPKVVIASRTTALSHLRCGSFGKLL